MDKHFQTTAVRYRAELICNTAKSILLPPIVSIGVKVNLKRKGTVEPAMQPPIAFAVFIGVALASAGVRAACPPAQPKTHAVKPHAPADNCVDLKPDPGVRPAPTIGYHWSLE
jgi:hypothetical protein